MKFTKILVLSICIFLFGLTPILFSEENTIFFDVPYNSKPWIGIKLNNYMKEAIKKETNDGVIVKDILNLSGLKEGDIIKKIDDIDILNIEDFNHILQTKKIGDKIKLAIVRSDEKLDIVVTLEDGFKKTEDILKNLGIKIKPINKDNLFGILVVEILKDSKANKYGINKNDIILGINRKPFKNIDEFTEIVSHVNLEKETYVLVMRKYEDNNYITVTKQIGEKKVDENKDKKETKNSGHSEPEE